jgi:hypothetical protein
MCAGFDDLALVSSNLRLIADNVSPHAVIIAANSSPSNPESCAGGADDCEPLHLRKACKVHVVADQMFGSQQSCSPRKVINRGRAHDLKFRGTPPLKAARFTIGFSEELDTHPLRVVATLKVYTKSASSFLFKNPMLQCVDGIFETVDLLGPSSPIY